MSGERSGVGIVIPLTQRVTMKSVTLFEYVSTCYTPIAVQYNIVKLKIPGIILCNAALTFDLAG